MVTIMNEYVSKINLTTDEITRGILNTALSEQDKVEASSVLIKSNRYIVDIHLIDYSVDNAVEVINQFMESTRYHYSAFFVRFNEGSRVRYRYASCKEDKEGFYCDVVIS